MSFDCKEVFKARYAYLKISLVFKDDSENEDLTAVLFKLIILNALEQLFGEVGKSITVDILKFVPVDNHAIIRVPKKDYIKVHTSLTLFGSWKKHVCTFQIHQVSFQLMSLACDSRQQFLKIS